MQPAYILQNRKVEELFNNPKSIGVPGDAQIAYIG
jgi:hypothetical protein